MAKIKWELEDHAYKYLEPEAYRSLAKLVQAKRGQREALVKALKEPLERTLTAAGIKDVEVTGRPKHLWSIHKKMLKRQRPYEEIFDLLAIRVLVNTVPDCTTRWASSTKGPRSRADHDYIAQPKSNGYQSLQRRCWAWLPALRRSARGTRTAR
jgi:GTP pyrophosphokinase